ncbi:hypothetical protein GE061_019055 [Apolygus lucorum]|uniref:Uncharacterized protein n=1 Tax=Apolygus lucorum TaxID=248454 RepID=A0A6A4JWS1_APOLU|nr:hypothetical protein GE061_019055 [Apolygus lucorum]
MFGFASQIDDEEDTSGNSTCPSTYKHFNASVKPRSKLGRRKVVPQKDEKAQDSDACTNGEQKLQSQWYQRDDSGICISGSTPSLTHPLSRTGTLFNNSSKNDGNGFTPGFTPSSRTGRENKFVLPHTPVRFFKSEPLKEINRVSNVINKSDSSESSTLTTEAIKEEGRNSLQRQLNSSFICDESLPLAASNDSQQNSLAANKTCNETANSDDSFMTCHDIHRPEVQSNKTFYDPEFLKTPGKNLAEIRIDESPFDPLEGFLEQSDDFGDYKTKTPLSNNNYQRKPVNGSTSETNCSSVVETAKTCVKSLNSSVQGRDHSQNDQIAYPLVETDAIPLPEHPIRAGRSTVSPVPLGYQGRDNIAHLKDSVFKYPGFPLGPPLKCMQTGDLNLNTSDVGNMRTLEGKDHGELAHNEDTTNVTYPQHSRGQLAQKNSFTSQFQKSGLSDSGKALSLSSSLGRPLSAASCATNRGVISSSVNGPKNSFEKGGPPVSVEVGTLMNHPQNQDGNRVGGVDRKMHSRVGGVDRLSHVPNSVVREPNVCPKNSGLASRGIVADQLDSSITWISCVKPAKVQSNHKVARPGAIADESLSSRSLQEEDPTVRNQSQGVDTGTVILDDPTVVAKGQCPPAQPQSQPPAPITPRVSPTNVVSKQPNPVQTPLETPQSNSVASALMKPQPQNVIKINGTPYTVLSLLGRGGSSQVYQALGPQSSKLMAIKCVNLASVEEAMATDYLNEIALLLKLQGCPSVIKMIEHEYVEQSQMLYVVLEKGDIDFSKLIKNISETKQISMPMITYYWTEMLNAVHEIHKRGIIHSDLKPANFLLVEGRLKLIDFGIASSLQGDDTTSVLKEVPAGTYNYMSPEAISGRKINRKSDVWSMGCILFNLLYGRTPFSHLNNRWQKLHAIADLNHKVSFPKLQQHTPPSLRLALRWCLIKDVASRPTVEELVQLSELAPHLDSSLGKEIDGMMCKYFRKVLPNLKVLSEEEEFV